MVFAPRGRAKMSAVVLTLAATPALAESPAPVPQASADAATTSITLDTIEVISQELNVARLQIQPSLGASTYYFGSEALETVPQGENTPLNQVLLQMPGVAQDSFGQIHVRGEHANVQFRINGVELPEGLSVFGQALETRFARSVSLLTGALPAQYGFFTAGVLDIQTKTGLTNPGLALTGKLQLAGAELRIWRTRRSGGLVPHRRSFKQPTWHRESGSDLQCNSRRDTANPRLFLHVRHHRSRHAGEHARRRFRRTSSNSQ